MVRDRLNGRIILISGATGAIGKATTIRLLQENAKVIAVGTDGQQLARLAEELEAPSNRLTVVQINGTSESSWKMILDLAVKRYGRIDAFIHTAGVTFPGGFLELTSHEVRTLTATNFQCVVSAARVLLPPMLPRGSGHFIVVGSEGGLSPKPFQSLSCATQFALRGFCLSLHEEVRSSGITVSLVTAGPVRSELLDLEGSDFRAALAFLNRPVEPGVVAADISRLLQCRKRESVHPALYRIPAAVAGAFPGIFGRLFPILRRIGQRSLRKYRRSIIRPATNDQEESETSMQKAA
jgi:3-oxoacyl-[acyl-carrier protein] reductase